MKFLLFFLLCFSAVGAKAAEDTVFRSGVFSPPRAAPAFSLRGSDGTEFQLDRYRGKVVALAFGYTHCPDVCPVTLAKLAEARSLLGTEGDDFQVIYITVDPDRDTPERLREYLDSFDATFIGGTGDADSLRKLQQAYGIVTHRQQKGDGYEMHHSSFVYLVDRQGNIRALIPFGLSSADMAHDARLLLKSGGGN